MQHNSTLPSGTQKREKVREREDADKEGEKERVTEREEKKRERESKRESEREKINEPREGGSKAGKVCQREKGQEEEK